MPIGTPDSGFSVPAARSASACFAAASACSGVSTMKALSAFAPATLALNASATSTALKSPARWPSRICATVRLVKSVMLKPVRAELVEAPFFPCWRRSRTVLRQAQDERDRKSDGGGTRVSVRVDLGGRRRIKKKKKET